MFTFLTTADYPAGETTTPRVSRTAVPSFEQRSTFGINPLQDRWNLRFAARTAAERDSIYDFFAARRGVEPFQWTTPFGELACWVCSKWNASLDFCGINTVSAEFELQYMPQGPNPTRPAAPTTAFGWVPDFQAQLTHDSRAQVIEFGDGYRQRITMGLQAQEESWRLVFNNRTNTERNQIRNYLRGARGVVAFQWTDPRANALRKYVCSEWSIDYANYNNNNIQATFRRVFEA